MSRQPAWVFETTDYEGTPVVLSRTTRHAKAGNDTLGTHPEIHGEAPSAKRIAVVHFLTAGAEKLLEDGIEPFWLTPDKAMPDRG